MQYTRYLGHHLHIQFHLGLINFQEISLVSPFYTENKTVHKITLYSILFFFFLLFYFSTKDSISVYNSLAYPGTCFVEQAAFKLTEVCLPLHLHPE